MEQENNNDKQPDYKKELRKRATQKKREIKKSLPKNKGSVGNKAGTIFPSTLERIYFVADLLLAGNNYPSIFKACQDKYDKGLNEYTIRNYIKKARELITDELLADQQNIASDILAKYFWLYQKATEKQDYKEAKNVLDSITKLTQKVQVDITSNGETLKLPEVIEIIQVKRVVDGEVIEDADIIEDENETTNQIGMGDE